MSDQTLFRAVERFASVTHALPDPSLDLRWDWQGYEEGIRFAHFRTYEQLRQLAADLAVERVAQGNPLSAAQRALAGYHAAYRDLQAILLGLSEAEAERPPSAEDWPVRTTVTHFIQAERSFFAVLRYTIERARQPDNKPLEMPDEDWQAFWAGDPFKQVAAGEPLSGVLAYYDRLHQRVLHELADVRPEELPLPSVFWEPQPMPVQFRLHRFDAHLRQHTIQIEKTLDALGLRPNEARRLLRLIYSALAEAEGSQIGAWQVGGEQCRLVAEQIAQRAEEVSAALGEIR